MSKTDNNVIVNNNLIYILSLFGYLGLLSILLIVYFQEKDMSNYVHYSNCYQPISDFSVEPGKTSNSILTTCGSNGKERCTKTASSLADAVNFANANNASKFLFNDKTKLTALLSNTSTNYINQENTSIYTKNQKRLLQSPNGDLKEYTTSQTTTLADNVISVAIQPNNFSVPKVN